MFSKYTTCFPNIPRSLPNILTAFDLPNIPPTLPNIPTNLSNNYIIFSNIVHEFSKYTNHFNFNYSYFLHFLLIHFQELILLIALTGRSKSLLHTCNLVYLINIIMVKFTCKLQKSSKTFNNL